MPLKLVNLDDLEFRARLSPNAYERYYRHNAQLVARDVIEHSPRMLQQATKVILAPQGTYAKQQRKFLDERAANIETMIEELYPQLSDVLPIAWRFDDFRGLVETLYDKGYNISRSDR